ncbi:MAG: aminotransferase class I/II-fold pyridoxal phosphate-dependent enzyme [Bacteroidota bacterium]
MIQIASRLGEVKEYYFSTKLKQIRQMNEAGKDVLNLGIGSPDLPPAPEVIAELQEQSSRDDVHAYQSYNGLPELRVAFAKWYARHFQVALDAETEVLPLIGSKEGIMHISMTYLEAGDEVLIPNPGYPAYQAVTKLTGATSVPYDLTAENGWLPDLTALVERDLSKVKIMWINYPHMPSGTKASLSFFKELIVFAKTHQILLVNDNPYSFILNTEQISLLEVEGAKEVALELNSLSKSHNMAGWRVGMLAGKEEYLSTIIRFKSNMDSGMYKPVQLAAVKALGLPKSWYHELNDTYRERREKIFELLDLLDCQYDRNQVGLFVWAKIPNAYKDSYQLADEILHNANVFITPGGIFGTNGEQYVRVSLCGSLEKFETAIQRIQQLKAATTVAQMVETA